MTELPQKTRSIDPIRLAAAIKTKRGKIGLRDTAKEIGDVSAPTLSRIEQGKVPDLDTYICICKWLHVSPEEFVNNPSDTTVSQSMPKMVEASLRADKTLSTDVIKAIAQMVETAYQAAEKK